MRDNLAPHQAYSSPQPGNFPGKIPELPVTGLLAHILL
jgi:hypothetical protein